MADPYAQIARFYDAEWDDVETDIAFYGRQGTSGRLLVLGCGSGRVVRGLERVRPVVGLDRSEPMLVAARARSSAAYVHGDMRDFDVGRFEEIVIPNASFSFLPTRADQAACLGACRRALVPGGALWIDIPMPDFARQAEGHTPERLAWEGRLDGRPAKRTREVSRRPEAQRLDRTDRYWDGDDLVATSTLELRLVYPSELEWMVEACGFFVDALFGDHSGSPIHAGSPRIIARARL